MCEEILKFIKSNLFTNIIIAFFTGLYAWTYYKDHKSTIPTITYFIYDLDKKDFDLTIVNNASHNIAIKSVYLLKKRYLYISKIVKKKDGSTISEQKDYRLPGWLKITGKWKIYNISGEQSVYSSISNEHILRFEPDKKYLFYFRFVPAKSLKVVVKTSAGKCHSYYQKALIRIDPNKCEERCNDKMEDVQRVKISLPFKNREYFIVKASDETV